MKFTYYTIIGKDKKLLEGHLKNVTEYAGFNKLPCDKELLLIVYTNQSIDKEITSELISIGQNYGAKVISYAEPVQNFLQNLYACWNIGYLMSGDGFVFRGGSDQIFSKDSFVNLYDTAYKYRNEDVILQANTIENPRRAFESRHILADLGETYEEFDYSKFESLCESLTSKTTKELLTIEESLSVWGKPTSFMSSIGRINRTDGCSWLMKRRDWERHGPLPPVEGGVTGDVVIHDRMQQAGYKNYIVNDVITYHFVQGESKHSDGGNK